MEIKPDYARRLGNFDSEMRKTRRPKKISQLLRRSRLKMVSLAFALPFVGLVILDVGLRFFGCVAPEDPAVRYRKTYEQGFSPFFENDKGQLEIRPEWINRDEVLKFSRGMRVGRYFLYPGFRHCRFWRKKESGTLRIFVLGGSTTFGMFTGEKNAFPAIVGTGLESPAYNAHVEVLNLGCPGLPSGRVANLLDTVLQLDSDLIIVCTGHNEMLKGNVADDFALGFPIRMRQMLLSTSTMFGWLNFALSSALKSEEYEIIQEETAALELGRIPIYDPLRVPPDQRRLIDEATLRQIAADYKFNLERIIEKAEAAQVPILFVLPIANLFVVPALPAQLGKDGQGENIESLIETAQNNLAEGKHDKAMDTLEHAMRMSPNNPMVHYLRGRAFITLGNKEQALSELQKACDQDLYMMHRITSRLESAMIQAAESTGKRWIDLRPVFRKELSLASASELFIDHCHPTKRGHRLIAEQVLPAVVDLLNVEMKPMPTK